MAGLLVLWLIICAGRVFADGMVVAQEFAPKVEIPNQQALIHFAGGVEQLVIETSFLGEGTNFAWVVPLPSAPKVKPVPEALFAGLRQAFQPRLIHKVHRYYLGLLFFCGFAFLAWRSFRDEASWTADVPLCLLLAAGAGFMGKGFLLGIVALGWLLAGASRGGWKVDNKVIRRWRCQLVLAAIAAGIVLFLWLPKVEVVEISGPAALTWIVHTPGDVSLTPRL